LRLTGFDLTSPSGKHLARLATGEVRFTRPAGAALLVVGHNDVSRWSTLGERLWTSPGSAHELAAARDVDRQVLVDYDDARRILHLNDGRRHGSFSCRSNVWNVAMDVAGRFSAATTQDRLYLFERGRFVASLQLKVAYAVSLAVSGAGVLVGTQDTEQLGEVFAFDPQAQLIRSWRLPRDRSGFHPGVRFVAEERFEVESAGRRYDGSLADARLEERGHADPEVMP
jgi:hypothetical protein